MNNSLNTRFHCQSSTCDHSSISYNNLLRHYRENPLHRPQNLEVKVQGRPKESADDVISKVLHEQLAPTTRSSRVKAFVSKLSTEELKEYCLPKLSKSVKPWEYIIESATTSKGIQTRHVVNNFIETRNALAVKYPELVSILFNSNQTDTTNQSRNQLSQEQLFEQIDANKHLVCDYILNPQNKQNIFRDILMPKVYEQNKDTFLDFGCGVVGSLCVSQRATQDVLRNTWGRKMEEVLGINIFPPKDAIVKCLNKTKEELGQQVGLELEEKSNGIVVATVNVQKYLEFLLSMPGVNDAITFPKGSLMIYQFTDLAPWLKWSRFSNGITTLRVKVVDPYNLQSLVITCGAYLGQDDYDTLRLCFQDLYKQISNLEEVFVNGKNIDVYKRATADGKQRRIDTGNSSAKSTYPICDAPEHCTQLGDMTLCSHGPTWTVDDSHNLESEFNTWLNGRTDNAQNRREFAKGHLGSTGRVNLVECNLSDYYIGGLHLALRSAETICHRIGQCATGMIDR